MDHEDNESRTYLVKIRKCDVRGVARRIPEMVNDTQ
jgi:hypothetical protein